MQELAHDLRSDRRPDRFASALSWNPMIVAGDMIYYCGAVFPDW